MGPRNWQIEIARTIKQASASAEDRQRVPGDRLRIHQVAVEWAAAILDRVRRGEGFLT